ncbi:TRAP transporter small permease subunit [Pseudooceanicola sp. 502str34]|uniref:TRAP transporter small permease subunit n=1 Tax=Maritimibacter alkaliphilus TaxID=404236 RepID=UPI001C9748A5|nr:TRAP transporter small permease subunit [Maritimibacter alkaliphilus]MBY6091713.1 TRAP transporter small permease subunit [Maritimibacter alkaliphilus]
MPKAIRTYVRVVDTLSQYVGYVAMYLIFLMVGILLLDAVTRNVIDIPLHWCIEAAQFTLASYYFLGGAMTLKDNDHVRMDLLYDRLSVTGKARLDLITMICLLFYLGVLLTGAISSLEYAIQTNERRFSMWNPSMIPIKSLMVGCIILMILQTVSLCFKYWAILRGAPLTDEHDPNEMGEEDVA